MSGKVIQFASKKEKIDKKLKTQKAKSIAHLLIDLCEGDFAIVFKTKDMEEHFDGLVDKDFLIAITDVKKEMLIIQITFLVILY